MPFFPWVRVLWPFLITRISCCLRGGWLLGKGPKLWRRAGKDQKVAGTSPFPPPPGSRSPLVRITSLNHSFSSNNNKKSAQPVRNQDNYHCGTLVSGSWGPPGPPVSFLFLYFLHFSPTTREPSLFFLSLKSLLVCNVLDTRVHCAGAVPSCAASDRHTDSRTAPWTFSQVGKCHPL